jgi:CRP-like cAMP-binding protein
VPAAAPSLRAIPFLGPAGPEPVELLTDAQRRQLMRRAVVRQIPARMIVYHAGEIARSVFIIGEGTIKSFRDLPSGRRRIAAFLFARDLFGLAEAGYYVNTVQAITPARLYELDLDALSDLFSHDSELKLRFLCKAVHVLREAQHHTIIVGRRDAPGRLAMLMHLLTKQGDRVNGQTEVAMPMTRSDIANYLGLSLESVVRASRRLERQGIVEFVGRHRFRILDRQRFDALRSDV